MSEGYQELDPHWEAQINALLDGELDGDGIVALEAAAAEDSALAAQLRDARELRQMLADMPPLKAPRRLRRKLLGLSGPQGLLAPQQWTWLRASIALACIALVVLVLQPGDLQRPSAAEIARAEQDLALALAYLNRATRITNNQINDRLNGALIDPVADTTSQALDLQPVLQPLMPQEFEL